MGQKINPISLRLKTNRHVDSSWFSDAHHVKLSTHYLYLHRYIHSIMATSRNNILGRLFLDVFPKKMNLSFFLYQQARPKKANHLSNQPMLNHPLGLSNITPKAILSTIHQYTYLGHQSARVPATTDQFISTVCSFIQTNKDVSTVCLASTHNGRKQKDSSLTPSFVQTNLTREWLYPKDQFLTDLESTISKTTDCPSQVFVYKTRNSYASAEFLVQEIASDLEKKSSVNQIWNRIKKRIAQNPSIKGVRLSVAGRINGIEMARTEIRKYGQTSLHSLSNQMDYAFAEAYTSFGILGVKVWICFHETRFKKNT